MAAAGFGLEAFDVANPQAFYLKERQAELESLADAALLVEGTRLPVHTGVLAAASPVLCSAFADVIGFAEPAGASAGQKRKREEGGELILEAPFASFSVYEVSLFLKLLYNPSWLQSAMPTLRDLQDSLPALLRLAHRLDINFLLDTVTTYIRSASSFGAPKPSLPVLAAWLEAAEHCQLDELRSALVAQVARRLIGLHDGSLADTLAGARALARCEPQTLVHLACALTAAGCAAAGKEALMIRISSSNSAIAEAAHTSTFEWVLNGVVSRRTLPAECAYSPWYSVAGDNWRFVVYPNGDEGHADNLAVYLQCSTPGVRARYTIRILDRNAAVIEKGEATIVFQDPGCKHGFNHFTAVHELHVNRRLPDDCLHLHATVTKLPS